MKVTIERIPESQVRLAIAAEPEEQNEAIEKAYRKVAREVVVPGFRKGKAPRGMVERYFGREMVLDEANRALMDDLYRKAIEQEELVPVGEPELDSIEPDPLAFIVTVPVYPTVDPGPYLEVRVDSEDAALGEDQVAEVLEGLRKQQSPWIDPATPRTAQTGDQITVDIAITKDGEEFQPSTEGATFELGETTFLAELAELVTTLKVGDSGSVDIDFAAQEDRLDPGDPRSGEKLTYTLALTGIKERELLALDDDFATTYANAASLDELTDRVRTNLHIEKTRETRTRAVNSIIEKIVEGATLELPAPMIDEQVDRQVQRVQRELQMNGVPWEAFLRQMGKTEAEWREDSRPAAVESLTSSLILREIAEKEGIEVSESDLIAEIEEMVAQAPEQAQTRQAYLSNEYLRNVIRNDLFDQKLTDRLIDIATEGGEVVINGYVPPAPTEAEASTDTTDTTEDAAVAETEAAPEDSTEAAAEAAEEAAVVDEVDAEAEALDTNE